MKTQKPVFVVVTELKNRTETIILTTMAVSDVQDSATTISKTTFTIMTLGIKGLFVTLIITALCHHAEYGV